MLFSLYARIGDSDCESIASGALAQPINAVSSLAYSIVGIAIVVWAFGVSGQERLVRIVFGLLMVATGAGSVMFHGPQGQGSQFVHDVTFLLAALFLAVINVSTAMSWTRSRRWIFFGIGSAVIAGALLVSPPITNLLMVILVMSLIGSDVTLHRVSSRGSWWYVTSVVAISGAIAMFMLGRTGGPMCDPDSLFQGHAMWHMLGAVALGTYFVATTRSRLETTTEVAR
ncbi:MAG: hypothetical protein GWP18_06440 [Proteobacteria bacterium]|nr:hypothetical protein [Pseudomonadota bacterium]